MDLKHSWCKSGTDTAVLADFFAKCVSPKYISHGEIQVGRALSPTRWRKDLNSVMRKEFEKVIAAGLPSGGVAVTYADGRLIALALVGFYRGVSPYYILEDLVVDPSKRGLGIAASLLAWIEAHARRRGIKYGFLESGVRNTRAHKFFEKHGYAVVSQVMLKALPSSGKTQTGSY